MAADQRKKRLSPYIPDQQYASRPKRRDLRSSPSPQQFDFNFNSHVSLKWDDNGKRVIPKENQIGISWRHLSPFFPVGSLFGNSKLADVVSLPMEAFELGHLKEVLSYEVWESLLTENERSYLTQFLPREFDPDQLVQGLLGGDNFHFGNPFDKWSTSLCSGELHPDAIVHHEKSLKTNKRAYYSELQQYHENMIQNLQKLKERCANSKDSEAEILQMMTSRSRRLAEKNTLPDVNGFISRKPEENLAAISGSPSSLDDKLYYSDNLKLSAFRDTEIRKRVHGHDKLVTATNGLKAIAKPKKADKMQKASITYNDGAKYMSYVKISKKQHEFFKNMKQSGSSIQSKTLNRVLGNLDSFNVKPYEMFVEEEQKRIHEHWSNMANKDVPAALHNWRNRQSERRHYIDSMWHEMEEKLRFMNEDENLVNNEAQLQAQDENSVNNEAQLQAQDENSVSSHDEETADPQDMDRESSEGTADEYQGDDSAHDEETADPQDMDRESIEGTADEYQGDDSASQGSISENDKEFDQSPMGNESPMQNPLLNVNEIGNESPMQNPLLNVNKIGNESPMQNPLLNVNEIGNESPMQNPPLNVNEEFEPLSTENQCSLQSAPLNVNEEFHLSSVDNASLNVNKEFHLSSVQNKSSMHKPPLNARKELHLSSMENESSVHNPPLNVNKELHVSSIENESPVHNPPLNVNKELHLSPIKNELSMQNPLVNVNKEFNPMDLNARNNNISTKAGDTGSKLPERLVATRTSEPSLNVSHPEGHTSIAVANTEEMLGSSVTNVWASIGLPKPYCHTPTTQYASSSEPCLRHPQAIPDRHTPTTQYASSSEPSLRDPRAISDRLTPATQYASSSEPSLRHPQAVLDRHNPTAQCASAGEPSLRHPQAVPDQPARLIDLESDMTAEDATKDLLNRHTNHLPFFNPYPNRDRSELLHSLIKRDNYYEEQKKMGLEFHPTTNVLLESSQYPSHLREQLQPSFALDNRHKSQSELFMNTTIPDNIYPDSSRYPVQGQGHFSTMNVRDWSNARISPPIQPPSQLSSGELLNHNWFASDSRAHVGLSGSDRAVFSSPNIASGSSSGDQSLYSVLSQCNTLRAQAPYNPVGSTEQIIPPTNYGQDLGGSIPVTSTTLPQPVSPFDYLSGSEAASTLKNTNMGWMSLGHQASGLHDPSGKPFLKSWNQ